MTKSASESLKLFLGAQRRGPLSSSSELIGLVASAWRSFYGSNATSMCASKIEVNRVTNFEWDPPILSFEIVRHGSAVLGGKYGDVYRWQLDIERNIATFGLMGKKRVEPLAPSLDVKPLVTKIVSAVRNNERITGVDLKQDGTVVVSAEHFVPSVGVVKETLQKQRKRFRAELHDQMSKIGWVARSPTSYIFEKTTYTKSQRA